MPDLLNCIDESASISLSNSLPRTRSFFSVYSSQGIIYLYNIACCSFLEMAESGIFLSAILQKKFLSAILQWLPPLMLIYVLLLLPKDSKIGNECLSGRVILSLLPTNIREGADTLPAASIAEGFVSKGASSTIEFSGETFSAPNMADPPPML